MLPAIFAGKRPEADIPVYANPLEGSRVDADALAAGLSAELVQGFPGTPMHRSSVASQESSGP